MYSGEGQSFSDGTVHTAESETTDPWEVEDLLSYLEGYCPEAWGAPLTSKEE